MYLPWTLTGASLQIPYQFGGAYALLGLLLLALSATTREQKTVA
jgi:hypothetical protein